MINSKKFFILGNDATYVQPADGRDDDEDVEAVISILPPVKGSSVAADQDSDNEDEPTGDVRHLPGRVVQGGGESEVCNEKLSR